MTTGYVRQEVLDTAGSLISGDRDVIYGDATESFTRIATIWSALLGHPVTPAQVGMLLAGMKLSRLSTAPDHRDSWIDLAGYAALGAEVESKTPSPEPVRMLGQDMRPLNDKITDAVLAAGFQRTDHEFGSQA